MLGDDMESWNLCCFRVGLRTEGPVGGVLAILFKVETNWLQKFTAEVKIIHHILFIVPTREILTREVLYFS